MARATSAIVVGPRLQLVLHMDSDWHVGLGAGRPGDLDRLIQRDAEGLPFVPAKTLTGIWRDACERAAFGLDDGQDDGVWTQWVSHLFGEQPGLKEHPSTGQPPLPARLSVREATLSAPLRTALVSHPLALEAITFAKPGVKIDKDSGQALEDHLHFDEVVRGGTLLEASAEVDLTGLTEEQGLTASLLLLAGARLVERIGGRRRRGAGRCRLQVTYRTGTPPRPVALVVEPWLQWLEALGDVQVPAPPPRVLTDVYYSRAVAQTSSGDPWWRVDLRLAAQTHLVVPARTVGNVVQSLDFVPGTLLLGPLSRKLQSGCGVDLRQAICSGDLRFEHATLEVQDTPGAPVPLGLFGWKLGGGLKKGRGVLNRLREPAEAAGGKQLKGERNGWVASTSVGHDGLGFPPHDEAHLELFTHNSVEDGPQRPTEETGGVYSCQAIRAGTVLRTTLRLRQSLHEKLEAKLPRYWELLAGELRLGRAKKDSYGRVALQVVGAAVPEPLTATASSETQVLVVWLLSDLLLRDERLRLSTSPDLLVETLACELGLGLQLRHDAELLSLLARSRRLDSWHVGWGLPRPSLVGLQAGSCFVLELTKGKLDPVRLAALEAEGLGERRAEGYGKLLLDPEWLRLTMKGRQRAGVPPDEEEEQRRKAAQEAGAEAALVPSGEAEHAYARILEKASWRAAIRRASLRIAADAGLRRSALGLEAKKPGASQLGALRSQINRLSELDQATEQAQGAQAALAWLVRLEGVANRSKHWPDEARTLIRDLLSDRNKIWSTLDIPDVRERTLTTDGNEVLRTTLWAEAVRTLVETCLRAHRRELERQQEAGV